jgi:hypothetical protein
MSKARWSDMELDILRRLYPDSRTDTIAAAIGRPVASVYNKALSLGLRKTEAYLSSANAGRLDGKRGAEKRFGTGHTPWNKGLKGSAGLHPNSVRTQFRTGQRRGVAAFNYQPIGALRVSADGYLERKVTDDFNIAPARRWIGVHRLVWEATHGPIPRGMVVCFLPGKHTTEEALITPDVLEMVSRADLARRNHPRTRSPELAKLVQLKSAITRQVNRIAREAKEIQS